MNISAQIGTVNETPPIDIASWFSGEIAYVRVERGYNRKHLEYNLGDDKNKKREQFTLPHLNQFPLVTLLEYHVM